MKNIVFFSILSLVGFCTVYCCILALHEMQYRAYERGAWAVAIHQKIKGNLGSMGYRKVAFSWGDPQTEADIDEIEKIATEEFFRRQD